MSYYSQIYNEVKRFNFPDLLANMIAAQAVHETGNFTSAIFLDCNNAFGYKAVSSSVACSSHPDYKAYPTIEQSADEIVSWIKRRQSEGNFPSDLNSIQSPSDYAYYLKYNGYFEDSASNYAAGIQRGLQTMPPGTGNEIMYAASFGFLILLLRRKKNKS